MSDKNEFELKNEPEFTEEDFLKNSQENIADENKVDEAEIPKNSIKEYFQKNPFSVKIAVFLAGIAVVLVLIVGIISGISFFWTIIWRMFLYGVIFAGMGYAIGIILEKYVPELFNMEQNQEDELGEHVDYTTEDDLNNISENDLSDDFYQGSNPKQDKLTKLSKEYAIPNDPKILADAIRTKLYEDK